MEEHLRETYVAPECTVIELAVEGSVLTGSGDIDRLDYENL